MDSLRVKTTSPERVVVMPEVGLEKVFLGGGGGGDLLVFSEPDFVLLSLDDCLMMGIGCCSLFTLEDLSRVGLEGLGSFSGAFLTDLSVPISDFDSSAKD